MEKFEYGRIHPTPQKSTSVPLNFRCEIKPQFTKDGVSTANCAAAGIGRYLQRCALQTAEYVNETASRDAAYQVPLKTKIIFHAANPVCLAANSKNAQFLMQMQYAVPQARSSNFLTLASD